MSFGGIYFTNRGRALQAKATAGAQLQFTRLAVGDGNIGGQAIDELTALVNEVKSIPITKIKVIPEGKAVVGGILSNQDIITGFYWRELGLFAMDPDIGEILYCYGNAGELAEYIPSPGGAEILEKHVDIVSIVGNAEDVSAVIDQSLVFATHEELQMVQDDIGNHLADYVRNPGYAVTTGTDSAYHVSTNPAPTGYVDGMGLVVRVHKANDAAPTINWDGLGEKPIVDGKGNPLAAGKLPAGSRVSLRYSSEAGNFQLLGEGGEYGTATQDKVLEGYTLGTEDGLKDGTMPDNGPESPETINLTDNGQECLVQKGYHSGLRKIKAVISGLASGVIKAGTTVGGILGTFTSDATALASQMLYGVTAYVNGSKVIGTMQNRGSVGTQNLTEQGEEYTISAGYHNGLGKVKATISNLVSGVIKAGVTVGGILGTYTADATAQAQHILAGKSAYVNGQKVNGNMPNNGSQNATLNITGSAKPIKTIPAGYTSGGTITAQVDDNQASHIEEGYTIGGCVGSLQLGKKFAAAFEYVPTSGETWTVSGLGFKPSKLYARFRDKDGDYYIIFTAPTLNNNVYLISGETNPGDSYDITSRVSFVLGGFSVTFVSGIRMDKNLDWIALE